MRSTRARDDHEMARQRWMYARLLFVVVGIFGDCIGRLLIWCVAAELCLGRLGIGGYTLGP